MANVANNDINNGIAASRNLMPGISAVGDAAKPKSESDYAAANTGLDTAGGNATKAASTYGDFANNGGFTPQQETSYLNRATSGVKSVFSGLGDQAKLAEARTGASSGPAALAEIARQGGQAQSEALENAQEGLHQQENQNKLAGSAGLNQVAGTEGSLAGEHANLYGENEGVQQNSNQQLLGSVGLQQQGAGQAVSNASNYSKTLLGNYLPNVSTPFGGVQF